jgi:ABC-type tungstate transport system permease subunit
MGATLNTASALDAYVLSDRATWLALKNNLGDLGIEVEGDKRLFNRYGVILVNPAKYPSAKKDLGQQFIDWLISTECRSVPAWARLPRAPVRAAWARNPSRSLGELHPMS